MAVALLGLAVCASAQTAQNTKAEGKAVAPTAKGAAEDSAAQAKKETAWKSLFDGKTLKGWKVADFAGGGKVEVEKGQLMLNSGLALTGVTWTNEVPKTNYEIALEAMKVDGSDFFCGLTFPVADSHCTFVVGGWGGGVVGISSIDGMDASENETTKFMNFEKKRWYRIRVRVTPTKLEAWIDDEKLVDQSIEGRKITMRPGEIEDNVPLGLATYQVTAALRNIRLRPLEIK